MRVFFLCVNRIFWILDAFFFFTLEFDDVSGFHVRDQWQWYVFVQICIDNITCFGDLFFCAFFYFLG